MEGDLPVASFLLLFGYFNPLPPHGGRLKGEYSFFAFPEISIHSLRMEGDYKIVLNGTYGISISIHSLQTERDIYLYKPGIPKFPKTIYPNSDGVSLSHK